MIGIARDFSMVIALRIPSEKTKPPINLAGFSVRHLSEDSSLARSRLARTHAGYKLSDVIKSHYLAPQRGNIFDKLHWHYGTSYEDGHYDMRPW